MLMMVVMRAATLLLLLSTSYLSTAPAAASDDDQCRGATPMPSVSTFLGATLDSSEAAQVCCDNHIYPEEYGYLASPEVDLFGRLDPDTETVFYDSVCGVPLFIAPRGRSFKEFREESLQHGWPSFRSAEIVSENVIIHESGRMESTCLTHLGHNLPDVGGDRYCVDLLCVAGAPLSVDDGRVFFRPARSFPSASAETLGGKRGTLPTAGIVGVVAFAALAAALASHHAKRGRANGATYSTVD